MIRMSFYSSAAWGKSCQLSSELDTLGDDIYLRASSGKKGALIKASMVLWTLRGVAKSRADNGLGSFLRDCSSRSACCGLDDVVGVGAGIAAECSLNNSWDGDWGAWKALDGAIALA